MKLRRGLFCLANPAPVRPGGWAHINSKKYSMGRVAAHTHKRDKFHVLRKPP